MDGLKSNKLHDIYLWFKDGLHHWDDPNEKSAITNEVFHRFFDLGPEQRIINRDMRLNESAIVRLRKARNKLMKGEPVQYVTGIAEFYGLALHVEPGVLIPRPETEGLVIWILEHINKTFGPNESINIQDVGTGSGCIAIALAATRKNATCSGCDLNAQILEIARINALSINVSINFFTCDLLHPGQESADQMNLDIMVSNPPYVLESEKLQMAKHVMDYEPHHALFVPDNDPLLFYRHLANRARQCLKRGGWLFVEINEQYGAETVQLFAEKGLAHIELKQDFHGKNRFIKASVL